MVSEVRLLLFFAHSYIIFYYHPLQNRIWRQKTENWGMPGRRDGGYTHSILLGSTQYVRIGVSAETRALFNSPKPAQLLPLPCWIGGNANGGLEDNIKWVNIVVLYTNSYFLI
jgi:hypothetical protein